MNFRLSLCSAAMLLLSSVGCCHLHSCVDPCDPCSRPLAGCGLSSWMHGEIDAWRSRNQCRNSSWSESDCGCSTCSGQVAGYDGVSSCAGGNCGSPVSAGGNCSGCSGGTSYPGGANYPGAMPTPIPADTAPAPPVPVPASEAAARMMMQGRQVVMLPQPAVPGQPVQVSWEEFQKLPGSIVSGPGAVHAQQVAGPGAGPSYSAVPAQPAAQPSTVPPQSFAVQAPAPAAAPTMVVPAAASVMPQQPVIYAPAPTAAPAARPVQQAAWTPIKQ